MDRGTPGVYVAHHPWYGGDHAKIGETGRLEERLHDSAYCTAFIGEFHYVATFETASRLDAQRLEAGVKIAYERARDGASEVVAARPAALVAAVVNVAAMMGIVGTLRVAPKYPRPPGAPRRGGGDDARVTPGQRQMIRAAYATPTPAVPRKAATTADLSRGAPAADADAEDAIGDIAGALPELTAVPPLEPRAYQAVAVGACRAELARSGRAILQMACRCGKTPVAHAIIREYKNARVLYLVPGLPLLRQTAQKLVGYGHRGGLLLVGSDPRPLGLGDGRPICMTTDPGAVAAFVGAPAAPGPALVVATYQSSMLVPDVFDLTVFDECHRVCGRRDGRAFAHVIQRHKRGHRLFMTATPVNDPPARRQITMRDYATFGPVAFKYHLRHGIAAGYVNDFRLRLVADVGAPGDPANCQRAILPRQIASAARECQKLLVFCRSIRAIEELRGAVAALAGEPPAFHCYAAHSRAPDRADTLARFQADPRRGILFNCRLFQEGVEIPRLDGVFFAAPRHSPRDIVQSLCRPLNRVDGKPVSQIFLPVACTPDAALSDPTNLARFATIVPFVDALLDEDPRFYEQLFGTIEQFPMDVMGNEAAICDRTAFLKYVRHAIRTKTYRGRGAHKDDVYFGERLLTPALTPFELGFAELRRTVTVCRRYPKGMDTWRINGVKQKFNPWRKYCAKQYVEYMGGRPSALTTAQAAMLRSLPDWETYGVHDAYPADECIATLARWLETHGGTPPPLEVGCGGFVGLGATPLERLSGFLTTMNQQDEARRFLVRAETAAKLSAVTARWGLCWPKRRLPDGCLPPKQAEAAPTFIQAANRRFRTMYVADAGHPFIAEHFPGYPDKHKHQEHLDVLAAGLMPPRWKRGRDDVARLADPRTILSAP